jgi:hypothetical protein
MLLASAIFAGKANNCAIAIRNRIIFVYLEHIPLQDLKKISAPDFQMTACGPEVPAQVLTLIAY